MKVGKYEFKPWDRNNSFSIFCKRIHIPKPGYVYLPSETLKNRDVFYRAYMDVLVACLRGQVHVSRRSLARNLKNPRGIRRVPGTPPEARFKPIPGSLGRRRPRQLLLHGSTSCVHAVVSAHGLRRNTQHPPNCASISVCAFNTLLRAHSRTFMDYFLYLSDSYTGDTSCVDF